MENMHTDMKGQSIQIVCSVHSYRYPLSLYVAQF